MVPDSYRDFERRLAAAMGVLNAAHGQLVGLVTELLEFDHWRGAGIRSPEHWLTVRAGLSHASAKRLVAVARRTAELPVVMSGLAEGALTLDHAHVVAQFAPAYTDRQVAGIAEHATVSQLRSLLSRYRFAEPVDEVETKVAGESTPPDAPTQLSGIEAIAVAAGSMSSWLDEHGRFHLEVEAPADEGALIKQAIDHARDILFHDPGRGGPRVTGYDALLAVCTRSFAHGDEPRDRARRDRFGVYLHLDTSGAGWLDGGRPVPPSLLKKMTCDGAVRPVWETEGVAVNVGRAQRVAPGHTRRVVIDRDGGCRFPGCGASGYVEVHHLQHWADGGPTDTFNLIALCPHHHDSHHRGEFTLSGNADRRVGQPGAVEFRDPEGEVLGALKPQRPPGPLPPPPGRGYTSRRGERFHPSQVSFRGPPAA